MKVIGAGLPRTATTTQMFALEQLDCCPCYHMRDLLVDLDRLRVVGINVRCSQGAERFLPLAAAELAGERINVASSLALLDESAYYGEHGASLRSLRGAAVDLAGRPVGTLNDIVLRSDGEVTRVVVRGESGRLRRLGAKHVRIRKRKAARR